MTTTDSDTEPQDAQYEPNSDREYKPRRSGWFLLAHIVLLSGVFVVAASDAAWNPVNVAHRTFGIGGVFLIAGLLCVALIALVSDVVHYVRHRWLL